MNESKWNQHASIYPKLSLEEFQKLLNNIGFATTKVEKGSCYLYNRFETCDWICEHWKIPISMKWSFLDDLDDFLDKTRNNNTVLSIGLYHLLIEKLN